MLETAETAEGKAGCSIPAAAAFEDEAGAADEDEDDAADGDVVDGGAEVAVVVVVATAVGVAVVLITGTTGTLRNMESWDMKPW